MNVRRWSAGFSRRQTQAIKVLYTADQSEEKQMPNLDYYNTARMHQMVNLSPE